MDLGSVWEEFDQLVMARGGRSTLIPDPILWMDWSYTPLSRIQDQELWKKIKMNGLIVKDAKSGFWMMKIVIVNNKGWSKGARLSLVMTVTETATSGKRVRPT